MSARTTTDNHICNNVITPHMATILQAKIRRIGNSLGILLPREAIQAEGVNSGDMIYITISTSSPLDHQNRLFEIAGSYEGSSAFEREREDRY